MTGLFPCVGHTSAEAEFETARRDGRLHHGWLLEGPSGTGKARMAQRFACRLLGADPDKSGDPIAEKVLHDSHPDLRWLARRPDDKGKLRQDISVSEARELNAFFQLRPALGGMRVGVIDSLDELNRFGANAILKTLEEPPRNSVLILISHGTRPVLPTIRSRCRTLRLGLLSPEESLKVLTSQGVSAAEAEAIASLSPGRPGRALALNAADAVAAAAAVRELFNAWPRLTADRKSRAVLAMGSSREALSAGGQALLGWIDGKARGDGRESGAFAACWLDVARSLSESEALAIDPMQTAARLIGRVQSLHAPSDGPSAA